MKPSEMLKKNRSRIRDIVQANRARNPRIFGSVSRGEDTDSSDLDILVDPTDGTTLFDIGAIQEELTDLLGVRVDVHTPNSLPESWRNSVVSGALAI